MDTSDDEEYQKATVTYDEELGEEVIERESPANQAVTLYYSIAITTLNV